MKKHIGDHIRVTLFDHDDTLLNTRSAKAELHKHIGRIHYNVEVTDEAIREHWGKPLSQLVCVLYGTTDVEEAFVHERIYRDQFPKVLFPSTIPTLQKIHQSGRKVGIVTATTKHSFEHDLVNHQFPTEILDYTQTEEDTPFHKPDHRVFEPVFRWLETEKIQPTEVLYVGDGLRDMQAARGAGFEFIGVETGFITAEEFATHGAISIPGVGELY